MCLFAIITPSFKYTEPLGPTITSLSEPSTFPEGLTGGETFKTNVSVFEISTCVFALTGPKTLTFSIDLREGPTRVTHSSEAYSLPMSTFLTVSS